MYTGLHRIELARFGGLGGPFRGRLGQVAAGHPRSIYLGASVAALLAILTAGAAFTLSDWSPPSRYGKDAMGAVRLITAASQAPERVPAISASSTPDDASFYPDTVSPDAVVADGLTISSQSWRRGGLGSNALMTFTLRNSNDFAVKDIEISCAFSRRDGSHLTDRTRVIHDTVRMKGRKSVAHWHVGFVNVYADRVKCTPVAASRI
jgi:hypothetical protein